MKILIAGDLQIYGNLGSTRYDITVKTLNWLKDLLLNTSPDMFVHMGDFGEENASVSIPCLTLMTDFIHIAETFSDKCYWLVGNHDYATNTGDYNLMSALASMMSDCSFVCWPRLMNEPYGFLSYLRSHDKARTHILEMKPYINMLFTHHPIKGSLIREGYYDDHGLDPNELPSLTFVGHYHRPDIVKIEDKTIIYTGSPMCFDYRDDLLGKGNQKRGVWLWDTDSSSNGIQFIENPHTEYYCTVTCNTLSEYEEFLSKIQVPITSLHVRLFTHKDLIPSFRQQHPFKSIKLYNSEIKRSKVSDNRVNIKLDVQPSTAVETYVSNVDTKSLDKSILIEKGRSLLQ